MFYPRSIHNSVPSAATTRQEVSFTSRKIDRSPVRQFSPPSERVVRRGPHAFRRRRACRPAPFFWHTPHSVSRPLSATDTDDGHIDSPSRSREPDHLDVSSAGRWIVAIYLPTFDDDPQVETMTAENLAETTTCPRGDPTYCPPRSPA